MRPYTRKYRSIFETSRDRRDTAYWWWHELSHFQKICYAAVEQQDMETVGFLERLNLWEFYENPDWDL